MCDGKCFTGDHAHSAGPIGVEILSGMRYSISYQMHRHIWRELRWLMQTLE